MYLEIDPSEGRTNVHDLDDLKSFSVRASDQTDRALLAQALAPLGQFDGEEHAWIDIDALREASGRSDDLGWTAQFDAMVAYASSKGWVNEGGTALRAHLESVTENPAP